MRKLQRTIALLFCTALILLTSCHGIDEEMLLLSNLTDQQITFIGGNDSLCVRAHDHALLSFVLVDRKEIVGFSSPYFKNKEITKVLVNNKTYAIPEGIQKSFWDTHKYVIVSTNGKFQYYKYEFETYFLNLILETEPLEE